MAGQFQWPATLVLSGKSSLLEPVAPPSVLGIMRSSHFLSSLTLGHSPFRSKSKQTFFKINFDSLEDLVEDLNKSRGDRYVLG